MAEREAPAANLINAFLRPQEFLRALVEAREDRGERSDASGRRMSSGASSVRNRVLAVVSNFENGTEQGSVFVFKIVTTWNELKQPSSRLILLSIYTLDKSFNISMGQHSHNSVDNIQKPSKFQTQMPTLMMLAFKVDGQLTNYIAPSSDRLRDFISECRRLQKLDEVNVAPRIQWLSHYRPTRSSRKTFPPLYPRPDLRVLLKPAHERLSPAYAGEPGDEELDTAVIRDEWIRTKLDECEDEYSSSRSLRIRIGTFNVNGKTPSQDLSPWVRPQKHGTNKQHTRTSSIPPLKPISPLEVRLEELTLDTHNPSSGPSLTQSPTSASSSKTSLSQSRKYNTASPFETVESDMLVFGFQELDLSTEALLYSYTTTREDLWVEAVMAGLGEVRNQYVKLASKQLVGMLLVIIVRKALAPDFHDVKLCAVGRGIMGLMGNKGATAVRVTFRSTVLSFVNAHLAANDEFTERRHEDFREISRRAVFGVIGAAPGAGNVENERSSGVDADRGVTDTGDGNDDVRGSYEATSEGGVYGVAGGGGAEGPESVYQYLNYRIDLPDLDVREMIAGDPRQQNIKELLEHDQLVKAMAVRRAFEGFMEGEINHAPTYRFNSDLLTDPMGYDVKRRPAYTDRILYMTAHPSNLRQISYSAHPEITMSDHRPVSAEFDIRVRDVDKTEYERHAMDLVNQLAKLEDEDEVPRMKVEETVVEFGEVRYKQKVVKKITLTNVGKIPVTFRLAGKTESELLPRWLAVTPPMGIVLPNQRQSFALAIYVDNAVASEMNVSHSTELEDIIILHTERGKDHFVTVKCSYLPTSFANELSLLVRLPGPIRSLENRKAIAKEQVVSAPREVMRLINHLMSVASGEVIHIPFLRQGEDSLVKYIWECLDTGEEFAFDTSYDQAQVVNSVGDALMQFLDSLPTSIVPSSLHERCALAADQAEAFEVVSELSGPSLNVWISLTAYLHYVVKRAKGDDNTQDGSLAKRFASAFAPILLRSVDKSVKPISPLSKRRFVLFFIE